MHIKVIDFHNFLHRCQKEKLGGYTKVFVPVEGSPNTFDSKLELLNSVSKIILDRYRVQDPVKILLYMCRETVTGESYKNEKYIIAGIKSCDFRAIELLDKALLGEEFIDPAYKHWRENSLLITSDCNELKNSCHCSLVEGKPFIDNGFDINLVCVEDQYIIQIGSHKGQSFIDLMDANLIVSETEPKLLDMMIKQRENISESIFTQNFGYGRDGNFNNLRSTHSQIWYEKSHDCVGCGACTNICPTCYCLILNDETVKKDFVKVRSYDSCQLHGYARVAGGASPRPKMAERFRNRYLCKFCYMQSNFQSIGCTGCGRCIDACPAEIDFRKVVHDMVSQKKHDSQKPVVQNA